MCLRLLSSRNRKKKNRPKTSQKVYKVYEKFYLSSNKLESGIIFCSLYQREPITLIAGKEIISDRKSTRLNSQETEMGEVDFGFHVLIEADKAHNLARNKSKDVFSGNGFSVIEFQADPECFVAEGIFDTPYIRPNSYSSNSDIHAKSSVYTRLTPRAVITTYRKGYEEYK